MEKDDYFDNINIAKNKHGYKLSEVFRKNKNPEDFFKIALNLQSSKIPQIYPYIITNSMFKSEYDCLKCIKDIAIYFKDIDFDIDINDTPSIVLSKILNIQHDTQIRLTFDKNKYKLYSVFEYTFDDSAIIFDLYLFKQYPEMLKLTIGLLLLSGMHSICDTWYFDSAKEYVDNDETDSTTNLHEVILRHENIEFANMLKESKAIAHDVVNNPDKLRYILNIYKNNIDNLDELIKLYDDLISLINNGFSLYKYIPMHSQLFNDEYDNGATFIIDVLSFGIDIDSYAELLSDISYNEIVSLCDIKEGIHSVNDLVDPNLYKYKKTINDLIYNRIL